jgi:glucokinase
MFGQKPFGSERTGIVIDASQLGTLRIASLNAEGSVDLGSVWQIGVEGVPTFTDALQRYERERQVPLRGMRCVMALGGATTGESFSPARSRWTISRAGLESFFGGRVSIINDVVARGWAALKVDGATLTPTRGYSAPNFTIPNRYMMMIVEEGAGAAIIDIDHDGLVRILDTEAGHLQFPPMSKTQEALSEAVKGTASYVTWEKMLLTDVKDPIWARACPEVGAEQRAALLAGVLGHFCVNMTYAYACWGGIILTGGRAARLVEGDRASFERAFAVRNNFSRLIGGCPVWHASQREAVLVGAAEFLSRTYPVIRDRAA